MIEDKSTDFSGIKYLVGEYASGDDWIPPFVVKEDIKQMLKNRISVLERSLREYKKDFIWIENYMFVPMNNNQEKKRYYEAILIVGEIKGLKRLLESLG